MVNEGKTEAVVFTKRGITTTELDSAGTVINSKEYMKVLGVTFDCNLTWEIHIRNTLKKCSSKLAVLMKIRRMFPANQFLRIVTGHLTGLDSSSQTIGCVST